MAVADLQIDEAAPVLVPTPIATPLPEEGKPATAVADPAQTPVPVFEVDNPKAQLEETRRPDIVLFVNVLPLGVIELKNAANEEATVGIRSQNILRRQTLFLQR